MFLVRIFGAYISFEQEHEFPTIEGANIFLKEKGFVFDEFDGEIHDWHFDEFTFATIQKQ